MGKIRKLNWNLRLVYAWWLATIISKYKHGKKRGKSWVEFMWVGIECWYRTNVREWVESSVERIVVVGHISLDYYHPLLCSFHPPVWRKVYPFVYPIKLESKQTHYNACILCLVCACWLLITCHQKANLKCKLLNHHKVIIVLISSNIIGGKHVKSNSSNSKTWSQKNGTSQKREKYPKTKRIQCKTKRVVCGWRFVNSCFFSFLVWARWGCDGAVAVCVPNHCIGGLSSLGWNVVIRRWCCQSSSGEIVVN